MNGPPRPVRAYSPGRQLIDVVANARFSKKELYRLQAIVITMSDREFSCEFLAIPAIGGARKS